MCFGGALAFIYPAHTRPKPQTGYAPSSEEHLSMPAVPCSDVRRGTRTPPRGQLRRGIGPPGMLRTPRWSTSARSVRDSPLSRGGVASVPFVWTGPSPT